MMFYNTNLLKKPTNAPSLGGVARGIISKRESIEKYNKNPKICLECGKPIELNGRKTCVVKKLKFCNSRCSAIHNNRNSNKNYDKVCPTCHKKFITKNKNKKYCNHKCIKNPDKKYYIYTKINLIKEVGYNIFRVYIQRDAKKVHDNSNKQKNVYHMWL